MQERKKNQTTGCLTTDAFSNIHICTLFSGISEWTNNLPAWEASCLMIQSKKHVFILYFVSEFITVDDREKNKITVCLSNSCYSEINLLCLSQFRIFLEMDVKAHLQPSNFKCFFSKCVHSPFELWLNAQSSWTDALYWSRFVKSLFAISSVITLKSVLFIVSAYMY